MGGEPIFIAMGGLGRLGISWVRWREDPIRMDLEAKWSKSLGMRLPRSKASRILLKLIFLPLELEHCSFSTDTEHYPRRTAHCMKVSGGGTAYYSRKKGIMHRGNAQ